LIANSSMSYVLETLEKKGYVRRTRNPEDKRSFLIELTEKGKDTFACMYEHHKRTIRKRLDALSEDEEKTLQTLLKKIGKQ
ncbi:MAG: MarR family winged helix-turn-helix transcriptional regulator, partial [Candidatus Izemoplasmataceae bacterium]